MALTSIRAFNRDWNRNTSTVKERRISRGNSLLRNNPSYLMIINYMDLRLGNWEVDDDKIDFLNLINLRNLFYFSNFY